MQKQKLRLDELQVDSFVTDNQKTLATLNIAGGATLNCVTWQGPFGDGDCNETTPPVVTRYGASCQYTCQTDCGWC
jgi:hypothetical protein